MARVNGASFQRVLTTYALERLLCRLSRSPHKERFVLEGAMLHAAWLRAASGEVTDRPLHAPHPGRTSRAARGPAAGSRPRPCTPAVTVSGKPGDNATPYQEQQVRRAVEKVGE